MALTYDPKQVSLVFGDNFISGFGDGTFITAAFEDNERFKSHTGADGEQSWTKNNNRYGTITISMKSTSPSRVILDSLKELGTILPCWVKNNSDQSHIAGGAEARIVVDPDVEYGDEEQMVEYVIGVRDMKMSSIS
jgi:hypothetical protein